MDIGLQKQVAQLRFEVAQLNEELVLVRVGVDTGWTLITGILVFFMQSGFALLEVATVKTRNTSMILLKNLIDCCVSLLAWWAIGYAIAFSGPANAGGLTVGNLMFAGDDKLSGVPWVEGNGAAEDPEGSDSTLG